MTGNWSWSCIWVGPRSCSRLLLPLDTTWESFPRFGGVLVCEVRLDAYAAFIALASFELLLWFYSFLSSDWKRGTSLDDLSFSLSWSTKSSPFNLCESSLISPFMPISSSFFEYSSIFLSCDIWFSKSISSFRLLKAPIISCSLTTLFYFCSSIYINPFFRSLMSRKWLSISWRIYFVSSS